MGVAGDGALLHVEAFAFVGLGDGDDAGVAVNPTRGAKGEGRGLARRQPLQRRPAPRARRAGLHLVRAGLPVFGRGLPVGKLAFVIDGLPVSRAGLLGRQTPCRPQLCRA